MFKVALEKVVLAHQKQAYFKPIDAKSINEGLKLVKKINTNLTKDKKPFDGLDMDDLRKVMAYVVIKRENPILEDGNNLNFEAAANSLKDSLYQEEKDLKKKIVEQSSRLQQFFVKDLAMRDGKIVVLEK